MRLLILANSFDPSVGGYEAVARMLAAEFVIVGMQVKVITFTPSSQSRGYSFDVVRRPSPIDFIRLLCWCDVFVHNNVSLRGIWPFLFCQRKWVIIHHGGYTRANGRVGWQDHVKRFCMRFATNISVSKAVANHLPVASEVIHNPYEDDVFVLEPEAKRDKDLIFLGRLVSEKGVDLLLRSLVGLRAEGLRPSLSIVGHGPEEQALRNYCRDMRIEDQVAFAGKLMGAELGTLINKHRIMVVPSRNEGFGIVALEGIACGCAVVGSDIGGLPEAIGECGATFPSGNSTELALALKRMLTDSGHLSRALARRTSHLARFTRRTVARQYLAVIERAMHCVGKT